jgi:hypothetical protein
VLYYAAEAKQYSGDVALTLLAWLLAAAPLPMTARRFWLLAWAGVIGLWFSYPLAFVLAAVGSFLVARTALQRRWNLMFRYLAMGLAWALSFMICYKISHRILGTDPFIWIWWDFAFLPVPPRSFADLQRLCWQLLNLLNSPSCVLTPLGVLPSAFLALGLFVTGCLALGRRWPRGLYLLIAPLGATVLASALHQYPFHGRLLIFLIPMVHLLVGEGTAALAGRGGARLTLLVAMFLFLQPALDMLSYRFILERNHSAHDSHGDLSPDLLDYLEAIQQKSSLPRPMP